MRGERGYGRWDLMLTVRYKLCKPPPPPTVVLCLIRPRSSLIPLRPSKEVLGGEVQLGHVTASFLNHIPISSLMQIFQNILSVTTLFQDVNTFYKH